MYEDPRNKAGTPTGNEQEARKRVRASLQPGPRDAVFLRKIHLGNSLRTSSFPEKEVHIVQSALHTYSAHIVTHNITDPLTPTPLLKNAMYHGIAVVSQIPTVYSWQGGSRRSLEQWHARYFSHRFILETLLYLQHTAI